MASGGKWWARFPTIEIFDHKSGAGWGFRWHRVEAHKVDDLNLIAAVMRTMSIESANPLDITGKSLKAIITRLDKDAKAAGKRYGCSMYQFAPVPAPKPTFELAGYYETSDGWDFVSILLPELR